MEKKAINSRWIKSGFWIWLIPIPLILASLLVGPSDVMPVSQFISSCWSALTTSNFQSDPDFSLMLTIVTDVRLSRILLTFLVGGTLAVSGSSLQAVFRNPLVDPFILGIASGAAFGAALALAFSWIPVPVSAFGFGFLAVWMSIHFAGKEAEQSSVNLVLSGMMVSGIFTALLTVIQFVSDPFRLQTIVHWTMGNLHQATWTKVNVLLIPVVAGLSGLFLFRWRLNVLALGNEEAKAVGVNPEREKLMILILATLATAACVAAAGIIAMFGLFVPHLVRMLVGPDNRKSLPANFALGGSFLLIIDTASRSLFQFEIPIGVFTMFLGAPVFLWLMKRKSSGWM